MFEIKGETVERAGNLATAIADIFSAFGGANGQKVSGDIFTMLGEEFGFLGAFCLLIVYTIIIGLLFWAAKTCRNRFGQLVCFGFMLNFFVYYFINISMVLGLMPTVGVPLPLMSFGGSSLISLMFGFGLCQNAHIHKDQQLSAKGS